MRQANSTTRSSGAEILHQGRERSRTSFQSEVGESGQGQGSVNGSHALSRVSIPSPKIIENRKIIEKYGVGSYTPEVQHVLGHVREARNIIGIGGQKNDPHNHNNEENISHVGIIPRERPHGADPLHLVRQEGIPASEIQFVQEPRRRPSMDKNLHSSSNQNRHISTTNEDPLCPISPMTMTPTKPIHRKTSTEHEQVQALLNDTKERFSARGFDQSGSGVRGVHQVPSSLAGGGGVRDIQVAVERDKPQRPFGFQVVLDRIQSESESDAIRSSPVTPDLSPHPGIVTGITPNAAMLSISSRKKRTTMRKISSRENLATISGRHYHVLVVDDSGMVSSLLLPSVRPPSPPPLFTYVQSNPCFCSDIMLVYTLQSRKMLNKTLKTHGHTCDEAEDGQIAVDMVKDKGLTTYDVILMDFVMVSRLPLLFLPSHNLFSCSHVILVILFQPVMDGPDATKAIRALGYTSPIIGCTGNTLDMDLLRFKESGCDRVIGKPFEPEKFHQFMNELKSGHEKGEQ